jgi:hypothetical protein
MRTKTIKVLSLVARWSQRVLEARLPMAALYGIRIR